MNQDKKKLFFFIIVTLVVSLLVSTVYFNTYSDDSISYSYKASRALVESQPPLITYFMMDGFSYSIFQQELQAGNLPNMKHLIETGGMAHKGITTFPSITGYAFFPMLTGVSAPKSDVFGLRWFDRNRTMNNFRAYMGAPSKYMNIDLSHKYKLLFEEFPQQYTSSSNCYMNRGVGHDKKTPWYYATAKYGPVAWYFRLLKLFGEYGYRDWQGFERNVIYDAIKDAIENRPKLQFITMASPDGSQHNVGVDDVYVDIVRNCDFLIGEFVKYTTQDGSIKDRLLIVTSDHGAINVTQNLDMIQVFEDFGLRAYEPASCSINPFESSTPSTFYTEYGADVFIAINGNTVAYLYFANPDWRNTDEEWNHKISPQQLKEYHAKSGAVVNLFDELKCQAGLEFVMGLSSLTHPSIILDDTDEGSLVMEVHNCKSSALVHYHDGKWLYVVLSTDDSGADPFYYLRDSDSPQRIKDAINNGEYLTRQEWMELTVDTNYPLAPVLAQEILARPLCGDLIITSDFNYDFAKDYEWFTKNNRGGHGGIHRNQTTVPFIMNGYGIKPGSFVQVATSSDLGATVRHITGLGPLQGGAGRVLDSFLLNP